MASNDTFISYRREASWTLVEALYQRLTDADIDCFYDIKDVRAGKFEQVILNQIRARPYFLLVLTPGTLERTSEPGDWLRREIEVAIETDRVIVPVYTPVFDLATLREGLPDGLGETIATYQAQELPHKFFKFAVQELAEEFLMPIDLDVTPTPPADEPDVARLQGIAADAPIVTKAQLTAQEFFERARVKTKVHDDDGAIADYEQAIRLDPTNAIAYNNRGAAWAGKGEFDKAIVDLDEAIRLKPDYAEAYTSRGSVWTSRRKFDKALADLNEAIRLDPNLPQAYNSRGSVWAGKGEFDKAIVDLDEAIRLDPNYTKAYNTRGYVWGRKGEFDKAIADYDEAIRLDPNLATAYNNRGYAWNCKGEVDQALSDLDEAIRLDPTSPRPYRHRGVARKGRGEFDKALSDLDEAIRLDPDYTKAIADRQEILRTRGASD